MTIRRCGRSLTLIALLALAVPVLAAEATPPPPSVIPTWTLELGGAVLWQRVTPLGDLVVATTTGLYGIDPSAGSVRWRHAELDDLSADGYREIHGTPFVVVSDEAEARTFILDAMDGRLLFDSRKAGIAQVLDSHLLPRSGGLLVFGLKSDTLSSTMTLLDIATGKVRWTNGDIFGGSGKLAKLAAVLFQAASGESGMNSEPFEVGDDAFLIASATGIYKIDARTGRFAWKVANVGEASETRIYLAPDRDDLFYVGAAVPSGGEFTEGLVYSYWGAYRIEDGGTAWNKPVRVKGELNDPILLDRGMVVCSGLGGSKLKLLDYATGESRWGKKGNGLKAQGVVVDRAPIEGGLLIATGHDSAWTNRGVEYYFNIVDVEAGVLRFKKDVKVRGRLLWTEVLPRGVLYVTTSEVNILDPASGKLLLGKSIASDGSLMTTSDGSRLYAFSRDAGALFAVDTEKATVAKLSKEKVSLGDKDRPLALEVDEHAITLISSQNIVAFAPDGTVRFHAHHPAPRQLALLRALMTAQAVRVAMASAATGVYGSAFAAAADDEGLGEAGQVMAGEFARGYGQLSEDLAGLSGDYFRKASARFKASAATEDFVFMMIRSQEKGVDLARVSKSTGEIVDRVRLGRDREPDYQADAIANRIYYLVRPNEIAGYLF
jgi:outer membrane protein assembly factor BamB